MIKAENLSKSYGNLTAVNNITLDIKEGELFGLLGPNGAGKSTFINIVSGLMNADRGKVTVNGMEYSGNSMEIRKIIGLVPQDLSFYEKLSGRENIRFFASLYGLKGKALHRSVDQALVFSGLTDAADKQSATYSGGMKRRLNIACGIAHDPGILFFDEPTVGIDPQSRNHILRSITNLNQAGKTILYTTHYMEEAEELCSRIAIMDKGKVIAKGSNQELQNLVMDAGRLIINVTNTANVKEGMFKNVPGVRSTDIKDQTVTITSDVGIHNINQIIEILGRSNTIVTDIRADVPSLETVFLNLTGRSLRD